MFFEFSNIIGPVAAVKKQPIILLIEDRESDVLLFRQALRSVSFSGDLLVAVNAWDARDHMEGRGMFVNRLDYPVPDLIVCDLQLPGGAVDFLKWLREHPNYKNVPVVLWSGHLPDAPMNTLLEAGANSCFVKTADFEKTCSDVRAILEHLSPASDAPPEAA